MSASVEGWGLWAPGFPNAEAWLSRRRDELARKPPVEIVASRMKRATSVCTRAAVEVVTQAGRDAAWPLDSFATVFGSRHGEIQIAIEQMVMMQEDSGVVSPARFKNSVHNTASGLFSIAAQNREFTTALAAGPQTFAMALLEATTLLATGAADRVVVAITDEPLPAPIDSFSDHPALGVALALAAAPSARSRGLLAAVRSGEGPSPELPEAWGEHSAAGALNLLRALHEGRGGSLWVGPGWVAEVAPPEAP